MSRFVVVLLGLSLAAGVAVALVHAQESSLRRSWQTQSSPTSGPAAGASPTQPSNTVRPLGSLTDRLKAIRSGDSEVARTNADATSPAATPATASSSRAMGASTAPRSLSTTTPTQTGDASGAGDESPASPSSFAPAAQPTPLSATSGVPGTDGAFSPASAAPAAHTEPESASSPAMQSVLKRQQAGSTAVAPGQPTVRSAAPPTAAPETDGESRSSRRTALRGNPAVASPSDAGARPDRWASERFAPAGGKPVAADVGASAEPLRVASSGPVLRLETTGPKTVDIGQQADYTIRVASMGNVAADGLEVTIDVPAWVQIVGGEASVGQTQQQGGDGASSRIAWKIDRLAPREQQQLQLSVVPRASRPFDLDVNWTFAPPSSRATVEVQEPQLQVALLGPDDVLFGRPTVYKIVLSNPGTGVARQVAVALSPLASGGGEKSVQQIGPLAAGETRELKFEITPREPGALSLQVEATAAGELHSAADKAIRVRRAELRLAVKGPALKYAGTPAAYHVSVVNAGDADAENVRVDVELPPGVKYVGGVEHARATQAGVGWNVGQLAAGQERVFDVQCEMQEAGQVELKATAVGKGDLLAAQSVATRVEAIANVSVMVEDPQGPKAVGADAVYKLHIVNRGSKEARDISAVLQFSQGIEPVSAEGHQADIVPGQVVFATILRLEPGEEKTLRVVARAETPGNHVFRAEVRCADPETRRVSEGTTRYFQAGATGEGSSTFTPARPQPAGP